MTEPEKVTSKLTRAFKIEGLSVIAIVFALFFTNGYVYLETLNSRLDIPISRLGYSSQIYAVYGGVSFLVIIAAMLIALSVIMITTYIFAFIENPERETSKETWLNTKIKTLGRKFSKRHVKTKEFLIVTLLTCLLATLLYGLWRFIVSSAVERAKEQAVEIVTTCEESTISLNNTTRIKACIAGESDDFLYLAFKGKKQDSYIYYETSLLPKKYINMTRKQSQIPVSD